MTFVSISQQLLTAAHSQIWMDSTRGWGVGLVYGLGLVKLGRGKCDFFRLLMGWVECGYECQMLQERSEVSADVIIIIIAI